MASHAGFNPSWIKSVETADVRSFTLLRTVRVGLVARISAGMSLGFVDDFWPVLYPSRM
jgi:hypothetical protein